MRHSYHIPYILFVAIPFFLVSCKPNFLDKGYDENLTIKEVFAQRRYAESFLTSAYNGLPNEVFFTDYADPNPFVGAADEMIVPQSDKFCRLMNRGAWNADNTPFQAWINMAEGLRKSNIFLENIPQTPMNESDKQVWVGEATFLRAFFHFILLRTYGPVPIMNRSYDAGDDYTNIRRSTLDSCVDFIVQECDKAAKVLPPTVTADKYGRATSVAALALKARLLLYRASPLWNGNSDLAGLKDNRGIALFPPAYDKGRWQTAADAAKDAIMQSESAGHALYRAAGNNPIKNYQELFLTRWNTEVIFARNCGIEGWLEKCSFPCSLGGWNSYSPTQDLVDEYEMENGKAPVTGYNADGTPVIDPSSGYVETGYAATAYPGRWPKGVRNMYTHREPRFYATVNFNGAFWISRNLEFWNSGADGKVIGGGGYSPTGYLLKKFLDSTVSIPQQRFSLKTWVFFRLGELYLNYAEALNEAQGPVPDAYKYVNLIRDRAGLPPLQAGLTQEQLRERIRHERRIELSFETHRFFDCHRWKIAAATDNSAVHGLNVTTGNALQDDVFYKRTVVEKRVFNAPKHYLFPLPQDEINKNPNLVQNPGW